MFKNIHLLNNTSIFMDCDNEHVFLLQRKNQEVDIKKSRINEPIKPIWSLHINQNIQDFFVGYKTIGAKGFDGTTFLWNKNDGLPVTIPDNFPSWWSFSFKNQFLHSCTYENEISGLFDLSRYKYLPNINGGSYLFVTDSFVIEGIFKLYVGTIGICLLDLHTGDKLWQYNITEQQPKGKRCPKKLQKILGIYKNKLFIICDEQILIVLDIQTGQLIKKWDLDMPWMSPLDMSLAKSIAVSNWKGYQELDLNTLEFKSTELKKDYFPEINRFKITGYSGVRVEDYLICNAASFWKHDKMGRALLRQHIIAFHYKTHEIDWKYDFPTDEKNAPSYQVISYVNQRLFVKDSDNKLYIFERMGL